MLKIIFSLLLLLFAMSGFSHELQETAEHEPVDSMETLLARILPAGNDITEILKIDQANEPQRPFTLLAAEVNPTQAVRLSWQPRQSLDGLHTPTPVLVVNGAKTGPVLCLTAAIHGDELNGIEIVRRIMHDLAPENLSGTIIGVPIVNLQGFQRASRYLADRRDLNRYFPGNPEGSSAARIAHSFFQEVISHCHFLVDVHTGSAHRSNLPQIRGNLHHPKVAAFAYSFGLPVILHSEGTEGMLRYAAVNAGIPSVTLEAGKSQTLQETAIQYGVKSIQTLLHKLSMVENGHTQDALESVYYQSTWVRVNQAGILFSRVKLGDRITRNMVLGVVTDPITNSRSEIISPFNGQIIGKAVDQVVMPGFAGFHIGIEETEKKVSRTGNTHKNTQHHQLASTLELE